MGSQQVCWTTVLEFVERLGINPTTVLLAGTPEWNQLPDDHPDKLGAVLAGGVHHSLRIDLAQEHRADASREICAAADWTGLARRIRSGRGDAYVPRRKRSA
ncbi:phiRv1 phage protein [Mycolicibacterium fortuitum]|uniref:PhiRv1 phage protein n=1 Tax=Mycolicibacterium fortuitum TaxID=1766 RepID=A0A378V4Z5_MYCFO|nr:phiRv1 phage protein [Mycolicibacterium fortuitum]